MTQAIVNRAVQDEPENGTGNGNALVSHDTGDFSNLLDSGRFNQLWKVACMFSRSKLVPTHFQNATEDCFIASQMAMRLGVDPFMFMQNTYVTNGKPGMEGKLAIALVNSSGKFGGQLRFRLTGEGDDYGCVAYTTDKQTGEELVGPRVTIAIAKSEGWHGRNPKWKNIPDLMLQYRSGAWFGRLYCPERLMGMQTIEELVDAGEAKQVTSREVRTDSKLEDMPDPVQTAPAQKTPTPAKKQDKGASGGSGSPPDRAGVQEPPPQSASPPLADGEPAAAPGSGSVETPADPVVDYDDAILGNLESFDKIAEGEAATAGVSDYFNGLKKCLVAVSKVGKKKDTTLQWRREVIQGIRGQGRYAEHFPR